MKLEAVIKTCPKALFNIGCISLINLINSLLPHQY